jgi:hypothetical protein
MSDGFTNVTGMVEGLKTQAVEFIGGLFPGLYPSATTVTTVPNSARILPPGGTVGDQSTDPRASGGYGTASHFFRAPEDTFVPKTYVGGSVITQGAGLSYSNLIVFVALGLTLFIVLRRGK